MALSQRVEIARPRARDRARAREPSPASKDVAHHRSTRCVQGSNRRALRGRRGTCAPPRRSPSHRRASRCRRTPPARRAGRAGSGSAAGSSSRSQRAACVGAPGDRPGPPSRARGPRRAHEGSRLAGEPRAVRRRARSRAEGRRGGGRSRAPMRARRPEGSHRARQRARRRASSHRRFERGSSGRTCSVERRRGARLVASTWRSGTRSMSSAMCTAADGRCSRLSRRRRAPVPSSVSATATITSRPLDSRAPIARAIALGTSSPSDTGASPTRCTGRLNRGSRGDLERESALPCSARPR